MGSLGKRLGAVVAVMALAGVAGCSSDSGSDAAKPTSTTRPASTTTAPKDWPEPTFGEADCPMPLTDAVDVEVTCGYVAVPENRLDPRSKMIKLAVARLHSRSAHPKTDPVVQLEGGPGFPSLVDVEAYAKAKLLDERDYILWDQRGTGYSIPNLDCTETNEAVWGIFGTTSAPADEGKVIEDSLRRCRDRLRKDGVDLDGYDTTQNAADLADIRIALGIDQWNLRGVSYGSALAIEALRSYPKGIRTVLLDSIVPPDAPFGGVDRGESGLRAFGELYEACAADEACTATYGDLHALFDQAAAKLDANPVRTKVPDPATGEVHDVAITGKDMWAGLFNALYDETLIPVLPAAAKAIASGDTGIIDQLAQRGIPFVADQVEGMTASVDCSDRQRLMDEKRVAPFLRAHPELGSLVELSVPERGCDEWGVESQPASFNDLLTAKDTTVPILLMAGRFDPITPPAGSKRVADALDRALLLFPNAGHGAVGSSDCARGIWFDFMDDPTTAPDTSCMDDLGPPAFG